MFLSLLSQNLQQDSTSASTLSAHDWSVPIFSRTLTSHRIYKFQLQSNVNGALFMSLAKKGEAIKLPLFQQSNFQIKKIKKLKPFLISVFSFFNFQFLFLFSDFIKLARALALFCLAFIVPDNSVFLFLLGEIFILSH